MLWYCETKNLRRKIVKPAPSYITNSFRYQKTLGRQTGSSKESFGTVRDKKPSTEKCANPFFYHWKFFIPEKFWNREEFLYELFRYRETKKNSTENRDTAHSLLLKSFRYQKVLGRQKGSSTKSFDTLRDINFWNTKRKVYVIIWYYETKQFPQKSWYPLPLLSLLSSDKRKMVKRRTFPLGTDLVLWDKEISTKNRDRRPSFVTMKFFDTKMFPEHRKVPLRNVLVLWDQKDLTENCDTRSLFYP